MRRGLLVGGVVGVVLGAGAVGGAWLIVDRGGSSGASSYHWMAERSVGHGGSRCGVAVDPAHTVRRVVCYSSSDLYHCYEPTEGHDINDPGWWGEFTDWPGGSCDFARDALVKSTYLPAP